MFLGQTTDVWALYYKRICPLSCSAITFYWHKYRDKETKKRTSLSLSDSWLLSALLSVSEIRCTPDCQTLYWYFDSDCSVLTPVFSHCVKLERVTQPRMQRTPRVLSIVLCNTVTISKLHSTSKVDTNCAISISLHMTNLLLLSIYYQ